MKPGFSTPRRWISRGRADKDILIIAVKGSALQDVGLLAHVGFVGKDGLVQKSERMESVKQGRRRKEAGACYV